MTRIRSRSSSTMRMWLGMPVLLAGLCVGGMTHGRRGRPAHARRGRRPLRRGCKMPGNRLGSPQRMALERTLSIIKPDAVEKHKAGAILARLEQEGFAVRAMK